MPLPRTSRACRAAAPKPEARTSSHSTSARQRPRAQPAAPSAEPARRRLGEPVATLGAPARSRRRSGSVAAGVRGRPHPRGPLGHDRRGRRRREAGAGGGAGSSPRWPNSPTGPARRPPGRARGRAARARRPRRAGPRHRRPDGRAPAAGRHPALRRRPRQRHRRSPRCCAASSCASRRPARRGLGATRTPAQLATRRRRRQRGARAAEDADLTRALACGARAASPTATGSRARSPAAPPASSTSGLARAVRRDGPRALPGRGPRSRRELDRGLPPHQRPRAPPRPRTPRRARQLARGACRRGLHRRAAAAPPGVLRLAAAERRRLGERSAGQRPGPYERSFDAERATRRRWTTVARLLGRSVSEERLRRWRLVLGGGEADGTGVDPRAEDRRCDGALDAVYGERRAGWARRRRRRALAWRDACHFPSGVVRVVQQDAIERLGLTGCCSSPRCWVGQARRAPGGDADDPEDALPAASRTARAASCAQVVEDIERRLADRCGRRRRRAGPLRADEPAAPARSTGTGRSGRTCKHYQPEHRTVIPERLVGHGAQAALAAAEVIVALDQSGIMAGSVVYAGVLGACWPRCRRSTRSVVAFDTAVVDLTEELDDPVEVLFGIQLGGGTDIDQALGYCQNLIAHPAKTVLVLISDLYEGGDPERCCAAPRAWCAPACGRRPARARRRGAPAYDHRLAASSPRSARRSSRARRTSSRRCSPPPSRAATSGPGGRATSR